MIEKINGKKEKVKWYYQTKDYKIHTLRKIKVIEEIFTSEKEMIKYFEDKICLGCQIRKDFIEIILDEKQIRIFSNSNDKFFNFNGYTELMSIFRKEYKKITNSKKNRKNFFQIMQFCGFFLFLFTICSGIFNFLSMTIISLLGIISMLLILPESISFFLYVNRNFPQQSFSTYKGKIITLPLFLIIFIVMFVKSLK